MLAKDIGTESNTKPFMSAWDHIRDLVHDLLGIGGSNSSNQTDSVRAKISTLNTRLSECQREIATAHALSVQFSSEHVAFLKAAQSALSENDAEYAYQHNQAERVAERHQHSKTKEAALRAQLQRLRSERDKLLRQLKAGDDMSTAQMPEHSSKTIEVNSQSTNIEAGLSDLPHVFGLNKQAASQLQRAVDAHDELKMLLDSRLSKSELTYVRIRACADDLHDGLMDRYHTITDDLRLLDKLDLEALMDERIALKNAEKSETNPLQNALDEQIRLAISQRSKVEHLLTENESALTTLLTLCTELTNIPRLNSARNPQLEQVMQDLDELSQRVAKF